MSRLSDRLKRNAYVTEDPEHLVDVADETVQGELMDDYHACPYQVAREGNEDPNYCDCGEEAIELCHQRI